MTQDETLPPEGGAPDAPAVESTAEPISSAAPALLSPGDMLVTLEFHLPGRTVPLSEVAAWTQGGLIALPDAVLEPGVPISVRNGDRVIAEGHLVRLDDCVGVRIDKTFVRR